MVTNQNCKKLNYDQLIIRLPKGWRTQFKEKATSLGLSVSQLVQRAVKAYGNELNHGQPLTNDEKYLIDTFNKLSPEAQKALLKFLDAMQR